MIKNLTQDQPENNHKIILHLIYTSKKCLKIEIKIKNINYVPINQEIKGKTIEKSEKGSNDFINFFGNFLKSETIFKIKRNG